MMTQELIEMKKNQYSTVLKVLHKTDTDSCVMNLLLNKVVLIIKTCKASIMTSYGVEKINL